MKWNTLVAAAARFLRISGRSSPPDTDCIDGGVRHCQDESLPKEIQSTQITDFYCRFSSMDRVEADTHIAGQVFTLTATKESCTCKVRDRNRQTISVTFLPGEDFFARLQDIVSRYDMAQENGKHYKVSGLPPDFGIDLEVRYASGEYIRTTNNQSCFLPIKAMEALVALFNQK